MNQLTDSNKKTIKFLCVDDEDGINQYVELIVTHLGFTPVCFSSAELALDYLKENNRDVGLIISDYRMPGMGGMEFRQAILPDYAEIPFLIFSGYITREMAFDALKSKVSAFVDKTSSEEELLEIFSRESQVRINSILEDREMLEIFLEDCIPLVEEIENLVLFFEDDHGQEGINRLFAGLHTLKGTSGFFQPKTLSHFTHKFEDFVTKIKKGSVKLDESSIGVMLKGIDILKELLSEFQSQKFLQRSVDKMAEVFEIEAQTSVVVTGGVDKGSKTAAATTKKDWIRAPIGLLDSLLYQCGESTVLRNMITKNLKAIELRAREDSEVSQLSMLLEETHKINLKIQSEIMEMRKSGVFEVTRPLKRAVRDFSTSLNKKIDLVVDGENLRIDSTLGEVLGQSLVHLIKNSIDHGIEVPQQRQALGKPEHGQIQLDFVQKGENIVVTIKDDGSGIDVGKIRSKLIENEMYSVDQVEKMKERELFLKIFESGFSTAETVTDLSGRGVGMEAVHSSVEKVGGTIDVISKQGVGSQIILNLPIPQSVQIIVSITVEVDGECYAIPRDSVTRIYKLDREHQMKLIRKIDNSQFIVFEGTLLPLLRMNQVLGNSLESESDMINIVLVKTRTGAFGLVVDQILDAEETVVKNVPSFLNDDDLFLGATFKSDGRPGLVINIESMGKGFEIVPNERKTVKQSQRKGLECLMVAASDQSFAIPIHFVDRLELIGNESAEIIGHTKVLRHDGKGLPLVDLANYLKFTPQQENNTEHQNMVIIDSAEVRFGLLVDSILDIEWFEGDLDDQVTDRPEIMASTISDERVVNILDMWRMSIDLGKAINFRSLENGFSKTGTSKDVFHFEPNKFFRSYVSKAMLNLGYTIHSYPTSENIVEIIRESSGAIVLADIDTLAEIDVPSQVKSVVGLGLDRRKRNAGEFQCVSKLDIGQICQAIEEVS